MLSWLRGSDDVNALIQKRQYARAVKVLEGQIREDPDSVFLRQQLADVLVRKGDRSRAIEILFGLVDDFAAKGFVAKGLAILKKIQRIDPDTEIADRLNLLVQERESSRAPGMVRAHHDSSGESLPRPSASGEGDTVSVTSEFVPADDWLEDAERRDDFNWSPLFTSLDSREVADLFGEMRLRVKKPGSIIYTQGEPGSSFFVLANGSARVYQRDALGQNHQLALLRAGDFFGTGSVLDGRQREYTITAARDCELLEIDKETFQRIAGRHPSVLERIESLRDVPVLP